MWEPHGFDYGPTGCAARLLDGAIVYRITSTTHAERRHILSGMGAGRSAEYGRFHAPHQITSYCCSNVLVSIAEMLYHMYRRTLQAVANRAEPPDVRRWATEEKCLHALTLRQIPDLVYTDAKDVRAQYDARLCGSAIVFPDPKYDFLLEFNNLLRQRKRRGVLYPSARHSRGLCIALFSDETSSIDRWSKGIRLRLQLMPEDQPLNEMPAPLLDAYETKIHPTMGYYEVLSGKRFGEAQRSGLLPADLPTQGKVDFVRRNYAGYPKQAVC